MSARHFDRDDEASPTPCPHSRRGRGHVRARPLAGLADVCGVPGGRVHRVLPRPARPISLGRPGPRHDPALQSWSGLRRIWFEPGVTQQYYPLLHSAFWLEHLFWGDATLGYHLVNVLWHATSAALFVLLLRRLHVPGAFLAGALFALHPVAVESVAWISEQ